MKPRPDKIRTLDTLMPLLQSRRAAGQTVVFTNGCFDLIHLGHVRYLTQARALGDLLVIAINSDETVRMHKGPQRPITPCAERMEILSAFSFCDYIFEFTEPTPHQVIGKILPDILVKGGDWPADQVVGREIVEAHGGRVEQITVVEGQSTSRIVERVRSLLPT